MTRWQAIAVWAAFGALAAAAQAQQEFRPIAQASIVDASSELQMLWGDGEFTEGPVAAPDGAILFSDIGSRIMRYDGATGRVSVFRQPSGKANGLKFDRRGRLLACEGAGQGGGRRISITDPDGRVRTLADRYQGKRLNSPNDLAVATNGRVYFTDPRYLGDEPRELDFEGVFLLEPDGPLRLATRDVEKPNGIVIAHDCTTAFVADSSSAPTGHHQLVRFLVSPDDRLTNKQVMFDFGPGRRGVDGMTLDREGNIHAAAGSGPLAGIYVFDARGKHLAMIRTPGDPTNCAFGRRPDNHTLYITAASAAQTTAAKPKYALYRIVLRKAGP